RLRAARGTGLEGLAAGALRPGLIFCAERAREVVWQTRAWTPYVVGPDRSALFPLRPRLVFGDAFQQEVD
ncbi:MAG: hypothetical protein M3237_18200, partial [Actinomycetota bacterium]|nr:hypothetical protein [Actinomycetota bacterium]